MNIEREQQINDAIELLQEALAKGEIEESGNGGGDAWREPTCDCLAIGDDDYKYRAKRTPREFYVAPFHGNSEQCTTGGANGKGQYREVDKRSVWLGVIKVREIID